MSAFDKVEFGDLYKFCVSLGLVLILASIAVPWLLIRDESSLTYKEPLPVSTAANRSVVSSGTRRIDEARQARVAYVHVAYLILPWGSGLLFAVGSVCIAFGFRRWLIRQAGRDERENLELDRLRKEVAPEAGAAPASLKAEAEQLIEPDVGEPTSSAGTTGRPDATTRRPGRNHRAEIEGRLFAKMALSFSDLFDVRQERKIGSSVVDGILFSRVAARQDVVVEVKVIQKGFKSGWLLEVLQKTEALVGLYGFSVEKRPLGLVVVVCPAEFLEAEGLAMIDTARQFSELFPNVSLRLLTRDSAESGKFDHAFLPGRHATHLIFPVAHL